MHFITGSDVPTLTRFNFKVSAFIEANYRSIKGQEIILHLINGLEFSQIFRYLLHFVYARILYLINDLK